MKKRLFYGITMIAAIFTLASCEIDSVTDAITEGIFGSASVTINDNGSTQELSYESSVVDCFIGENNVSTLSFSCNVDLSNSALVFPFMAYQFSDTTTGTYTCTQILTEQFLRGFNFDTLASVISCASGVNIVAIAVSDTAWYISNGGTISVSDYPWYGGNVEGTFNNITAYYFTQSDIDRLNADLDNGGTFNLNAYGRQVTLNGTFASRRYAIIHTLIENAFGPNGGLNK